MTANVMPEDKVRCLDAGMHDFLRKPIEKEALVAALRKIAETTLIKSNSTKTANESAA